MSRARVVKQASYAGGCLLSIILVITGVGLLVARPQATPQATPTPPPKYQPVAIESVALVAHGNTADAVARLRNPNAGAGIGAYTVTFVFYDAQDREVARRAEATYILPGSLQYVASLSVPLSAAVHRVEAALPQEPGFTELPPGVDLPTFGSFLRERTVRTIGEAAIEEQKGIIRNTSTFDFQRVGLTAVAEGQNGQVVGISKTFVGELKVGEQREFTVQWPAPAVSAVKVTIFPSTNAFLEENIIRAIGDPSLLR